MESERQAQDLLWNRRVSAFFDGHPHSALFAMSAVLYYRLGGNCRAWLQKLLGEWLTKAFASYGTIPAVLNFFLWLLGLALHFGAVWLWIGSLTGPLWQAWDLGSTASTRPQRISRYLTSYWKSHDDFLPRVVATLQQQSSLPLSPPDLAGRLRSSSRSRAFRSGIRLGLVRKRVKSVAD